VPTPLRRSLRHARRWTFYLSALLLVGVALLVGAASQLLPLVGSHPEHVAAWLSERAGRPVRFDKVETRWTRRGPLLQFDGLRIGEPGQGVRIGRAEVLVAMYSGLLPGQPLTELRLRGLSLTVQRGDDGRWSVRGLPPTEQGGDPLDSLQRLGELQVIGARVAIDAPSLGLPRQTVPRADLRLRVDGTHLRAGMRGWISTGAPPLRLALDFDRHAGRGRAWLEARPVDLAAWAPLLRFAGVSPTAGQGRARLWLSLRDARVDAITGDFDLYKVGLSGAMPAGQQPALPTLALGRVETRWRWQRTATGWRLDVPRLRIGDGKQLHVMDGIGIAGGQGLAVLAGHADVSPLLAVAGLSDRLPPDTRRWIAAAHPRLRLGALWLAGKGGGPMQVHGRLEELAFDPAGNAPGISGVHGAFEGDADGFLMGLTPDRPVVLDWPRGFGVVHRVRLSGTVVGWRQGAGWRIESPALRVQGEGYAADMRGGLWFQGDGTRPWINLAARIDDTPVPVAKKFWIRSMMPAAAVEWLDMALVDGTVSGGQGLAVGDLDDWPFTGHDGRFEASGHIVDGRIRFQKDWPAMENLDAGVAFVGNGFALSGRSARLGQVGIQRVEAGIEDFGKGLLKVRADGQADAAKFVDLLRHSPLHAEHADVLDHIQTSGDATASFAMDLPLDNDPATAPRITGDIALRNARLADPRWQLAFDNVNGKAGYGDGGFVADRLQVTHLGHPGQLSLRAGDYVRDARQAFEAELAADLPADTLLDHAPELAWLKPYLDGHSAWTIGVTLPKTPPLAAGAKPVAASITPPGHLHLHSDLLGTAMSLPAPLDKPASRPLAVDVDSDLPLDGGQVDVVLGHVLALRARSREGRTGVVAVLGADRVDRDPPASGWSAFGHADALDALGWIALASGRSGSSGGDLPMRVVDVRSDRLQLFGGAFADTRVQMRPVAGGLSVEASGPNLQGHVAVPDAVAQPVTAHFQRAWWQPQPALPAASAPPLAAQVDDTDPAAIPPLAIDIDDLHLGQGQWGALSLRTRKTAGGLQVQRMTLRSPKQSLDIGGRWTGRGSAAGTQVLVSADSRDLGQLSTDLGIGGQVRGGEGKLVFDASWPGSPAAFQLGQLQGSLTVKAENGQLLEVDPGAGRLLGLVSVGQLPRRMMLDFRDFFSKGLAFNQLSGSMQFGNGVARTDDLHIDGPAVKIAIHGSADLRAETFDQTVDVNPKSGNLLTVVGAVTGGPIGAAVGAAANAVLGKPLGEIGARSYHVTGPWTDPKVDVVERAPATTPVPATPPVPASVRP